MANVESVGATFLASIKSIGTAVTMAAVGFYLHHREFVTTEGKRAIALMSQQVTFPLFLFTKIIYCNQDWSEKPCPDVTSTLHDTWMLLLWPLYMVGTGLIVGNVVARLTSTPQHQKPAVLAACGFANNTALPITLLAVVHANFPSTSNLGRIDPTLFLSVYLIVYPIIQWGLGGYILAPASIEDKSDESSLGSLRMMKHHRSDSITRNVLNNKEMVKSRMARSNRLSSTDEGNYMSILDLEKLEQLEQEREDAWVLENLPILDEHQNGSVASNSEQYPLMETSVQYDSVNQIQGNSKKLDLPDTPRIGHHSAQKQTRVTANVSQVHHETDSSKNLSRHHFSHSQRTISELYETDTTWETVKNILARCVNPPMIGAILGIICAMTPARGVFVDVVNRHSGAPLQWLFDGLYKVGQLAVPDNMLILGCNLSASYKTHMEGKSGKKDKSKLLSIQTMAGIVIGKMLVMPFIGILSTYILKYYVLDIPEDIAAAFYLVLMIVFLTPTANNVMIMIELANTDVGVLQGTANVIALQYVVAPVVLSVTMTIAIGVASEWT